MLFFSDVNQDGLCLIIEAPPPPSGPQIAKEFNAHMKNLLFLVFPICTYVSSVMRSSQHFSTSGFNILFPRTPKKWKKNIANVPSDYFHILHVERIAYLCEIYLKCLRGLEAYIYISNVYEFCWPIYMDLGWPGGYICGCGRLSNLVNMAYYI